MAANKIRPVGNDVQMVDMTGWDDMDISSRSVLMIEGIIRELNYAKSDAEISASFAKLHTVPVSIEAKRTIRHKLLEKVSKQNASWMDLGKDRFMTATKKIRDVPSISVWGGSLKTVEGHFGPGVTSYFVFLRWLFFLNVFIFLVVFPFVVIPQIVFPATTSTSSIAVSSAVNTSIQCSTNYEEYIANTTDYSASQVIIDFLQGTGWMTRTILFYGVYENQAFSVSDSFSYNMPLAYLCVVGVALLFSLILMVCSMTQTLKRNITDNAEQVNMRYSAAIFSSWDYTLTDENNAVLKSKSLYQQFCGDLDEERRELKRAARTGSQKCGLYSIRFLINFVVLILLGAGGYLIYYVTEQTLVLTSSSDYSSYNSMLQLLIEFLPSLTITVLNAVLPTIFKMMVKAEEYRPMFAVQMTIVRAVLLRLASVAFLVATLYAQVLCSPQETVCNTGIEPTCTPLRCWETYVGQNFYKLVIMDFIALCFVTLFVEFPRKLIVDKCQCKLAQMAGYQEFDIPKNVLHLVYGQVICWFGVFFCPLIPGMTVAKYFILFYIKKGSTIHNMKPSDQPFRASKSNTFFMVVLLLSYFLCAIPIAYIIARIPPSKGCGPFRIYSLMYEVTTTLIASWPDVVKSIIDLIGSAGFIVPLVVLLILLIYYYATVGSAFRSRNDILKEQLILEGKDKQFMVARLNQLGDKQTSSKKSLKNIVFDAAKVPPVAKAAKKGDKIDEEYVE